MAPRRAPGRGRQAPVVAEEPYIGPFVSREREQEFHDDYRHRKTHKGKFINSNLLDSGNLRVIQKFETLGWRNILSFNDSFSPNLIRMFYANLSFNSHDLSINSKVNNTLISITREDLRTILGITTPVGMVPPIAGHSWPDHPPYFPHSSDNAMRELVCNKRIPLRGIQPKYKYLTLNARLIHTIVRYNIIPHSGSKAIISKYEAFLTWCILNGLNFDLPTLIFRHMLSFREKKSSKLSYTSLIHKILAFCNVPLNNIVDLENYTYLDGLDRTCIRKMGYMTETEDSFFWARKTGEPENHNGNWDPIEFTRRGRHQQQAPIANEEEEEQEEEDEEDEEMEDVPESSSARLSNRQLLESLVRSVDQLHVDTQAIRQDYAQVNTRLESIEGRLGFWDNYFWGHDYQGNYDDDGGHDSGDDH